jgi:cellulose biosynthesis protein BcsQ
MKKIVITNEKGGTGKSTIAALLVEYLNQEGKKVQLIDVDPLQTTQTWVNNCKNKGRSVSHPNPDYQIIDTAGSSGSYIGWIRSADLIIVPLQMHYADLKVTLDLFLSWNQELRVKVVFLPNRWQKTKEQREGMKQLQLIVNQEKNGTILSPLSNRPALYGELLNGSQENFFTKAKSEEAQKVIKSCLNFLKSLSKNST